MLPFGLGIPEIQSPRIHEAFRNLPPKAEAQRRPSHRRIISFLNYTKFPTTFDGSLPVRSVRRGFFKLKDRRVFHSFQNVGDVDMVGTVTYATVWESEKKAAISVTFTDGTSSILTQPMTDAEFADYKTHPEMPISARFWSVGKTVENQYELFRVFCGSEQGFVSRNAIAANLWP